MDNHDKLLNTKIFEMHFRNSSQVDNKTYSLIDFCSLEELESRQFYTTEDSDNYTYYEIKKQILKTGNKKLQMLQLIDVSIRIRCDVLTGN